MPPGRWILPSTPVTPPGASSAPPAATRTGNQKLRQVPVHAILPPASCCGEYSVFPDRLTRTVPTPGSFRTEITVPWLAAVPWATPAPPEPPPVPALPPALPQAASRPAAATAARPGGTARRASPPIPVRTQFWSRLPLTAALSLLAMVCSSVIFIGSLTLYYAGGACGV